MVNGHARLDHCFCFANHCLMQLRENVSNEVIVVSLKSTTLTFLSPLDTHILNIDANNIS